MCVYALPSVTGLKKWVDYIPVKEFNPTPGEPYNSYDANGRIPISVYLSNAGRTAWIDYIPVFVVSDPDANRWRTDETGFIPYIVAETI